jgi:hypothetical protein
MFYIVIGATRLSGKTSVNSGLKSCLDPSTIAFLAHGDKDA